MKAISKNEWSDANNILATTAAERWAATLNPPKKVTLRQGRPNRTMLEVDFSLEGDGHYRAQYFGPYTNPAMDKVIWAIFDLTLEDTEVAVDLE